MKTGSELANHQLQFRRWRHHLNRHIGLSDCHQQRNEAVNMAGAAFLRHLPVAGRVRCYRRVADLPAQYGRATVLDVCQRAEPATAMLMLADSLESSAGMLERQPT